MKASIDRDIKSYEEFLFIFFFLFYSIKNQLKHFPQTNPKYPKC